MRKRNNEIKQKRREKQGQKEKNKQEREKISRKKERKKKIKLSARNFKKLDSENLKNVVDFLVLFFQIMSATEEKEKHVFFPGLSQLLHRDEEVVSGKRAC